MYVAHQAMVAARGVICESVYLWGVGRDSTTDTLPTIRIGGVAEALLHLQPVGFTPLSAN